MVTIRCDKCDQSIPVETPLAGLKVTCPHCGDVNVLRSITPAAPVDRAQEAGLPPASGPEVDVRVVRPSLWRSRPFSFLLALLMLLSGGVLTVVFLVSAAIPLAIGAALIALLGLAALVYWWVLSLNEGLKITSRRLIDSEGILSRSTSEILHSDIKNIQIRQTFWERILGVGTLAISSAAENEDEIEMRGIPHPDEVRRVIDLYRSR
ncbi:MAG: PH domain-containing protein [Planctomycetota bacterium]|nr:PH domain-containing protein [Planctomycetota bacterium]